MKKLHLRNEKGTRLACGKDPRGANSTDDHVIITCGTCLKLVNISGRTGEMLKGF